MKKKERNWLEYCKTKNLCPYLGISKRSLKRAGHGCLPPLWFMSLFSK
ncbi:MAG: hypothetical protein QXG39_02780 [Candidatus Aenigmatarchaeota archaeon]